MLFAVIGGVALAGGVVALIALLLSGPEWFSPPPFRRPSSREKADIRAAFERRDPEVTNSVGIKFRFFSKGQERWGAIADRDFYIMDNPVTVRQYATVMGCRVAYRYQPDERVEVSVEEAHQFCRELSDIEEDSYRLPNDSERRYMNLSSYDWFRVVRALPERDH